MGSVTLRVLRRTPGIIALIAIACLAGPVAAALAHAELTSTVPASGATVAQSPKTIVLTFSEAADAKLSLVRVIDANGNVVPGVSKVQPVPGKPQELQVEAVREPEPGRLHRQLAFRVRDGWPRRRRRVRLRRRDEAGAGKREDRRPALHLTLDDGALRRRSLASVHRPRRVHRRRLHQLVRPARQDAAGRSAVPPARRRRGRRRALRDGVGGAHPGGCAVASPALRDHARGSTWSRSRRRSCSASSPWSSWTCGRRAGACGCSGPLGVLAVLVHVLAGHAAGPSSWRILNIFVQWVHMTSVGVWIGGLAWLLLGIRGLRARRSARTTWPLSRGSRRSRSRSCWRPGSCAGVVEVGSLGNLLGTTYGVTLLVKVAMVAGLVVLGALNHYRWTPLLRTKEGAARTFRLNSGGELAVAAAVLAATAILSGLAPASTAAAAGGTPASASGVTVSGADFGTTVRVHLTVSPGAVGRNVVQASWSTATTAGSR